LFQRERYQSEKLDNNPNEDIATDPDINLQSYFGRINLGFDSRYLLTVNYRRDGTSRFSKENRWGNFQELLLRTYLRNHFLKIIQHFLI
jgi:iron complex outermembrane receptor protein